MATFWGIPISRSSNQLRIHFRTVLGVALRSGSLRKRWCLGGGRREGGLNPGVHYVGGMMLLVLRTVLPDP